jgi:prevent-host-death family protein
MPEIGMHEAKTKLSQLVERAERGEEIVITRNGTPAVRLTPVPKPTRLASARGVFKGSPNLIDETFDELPDDVAEALGMKP